MGKKPFYYAHLPTKNLFVFGSEAKALLQHPAVSREMDFEAAVRYLVFEHVPAPYAIFKGMRKLTPGQRFTYDLNSGALQLDNYWDPPFGAELAPHGRDITRDEGYWVSQVRQGLESAVQRRLVSDVPLGVFLSGGVDSSAVTAMMVKLQGAANVKTFSIGFSDPTFDESPRARALAKHLGTQHHEEILDPHAALDVLPDVGDMLDEPFADPSILPTYLLARFTRRHVTVALSGDGGDELFAGYHTFQALRAARLYNAFIPGFIDRGVVRPLARRLPVGHGYFAFDFKVKQFLRGVKCDESQRLWRWLGAFVPGELAQVLTPEALSAGNLEQVYDQVRRYHERVATHDAVVRDSYLYAKTYLPEEVLVKVDRATMACSLEARAPLLDTDLVELAARIPSRFKVRGVRGQRLKWIFKEALRGLVPDEILDQSKRGFGVPVGAWFRNELKDVLRDTLHPRRIREAGLVRPEAVQRLIDEHLAGKADHRKPLFTLFMFERWRQKWGK